jgi:hypothetical protein
MGGASYLVHKGCPWFTFPRILWHSYTTADASLPLTPLYPSDTCNTPVPVCCPQGLISAEDWQRFIPSLLLVLTALVYIPLTVYDIVMHVSFDDFYKLYLHGIDDRELMYRLVQ